MEEVRKELVRLYDHYQKCNPCQSSENVSSSSNQNVANFDMDENLEIEKRITEQFKAHANLLTKTRLNGQP